VQSDIESVDGSFEQEPRDDLEEEKEETPRFLPEDRKARREILRERRSQLKKTERAYKETAKQTKAALKNMVSGDLAGLRMAENMLVDLTKMLKADQSVMAILEVMDSTDLDDPLFVHAMNVCVLSMLVGNLMGLEDEELVSLGLGALAHDIGYLNLPREVLLTTAGFTREGANMKLHIQQGLTGVGRIPEFPEAGVQIIAQHHERLNGKGYPYGLTQNQISPLAKIIMIIDEYDELCNGQGQELTPYEALSLMYQNTSVKKNCEFDENILIQLIKSLGIYPPGTLVKLNDGSVGIVISINPQCRTLPQVMIYVPDVPHDEATIVDLSEDKDLTIEKSLRPKELSKEAKRYLNPSRATGFFPSSTEISLFAQTQ
jgi:HD-GYP domain-containing protein (c-di-GMP phosphodiesterase class II)